MFTGTFPAQSNRADWVFRVETINADTGAAVDLTGVTITIAVSNELSGHALNGSTTDGKVTINAPATAGIFQWRFTPADMANLMEDFYDVGVRFTYPTGEVVQFIKAQLPVIEGVQT